MNCQCSAGEEVPGCFPASPSKYLEKRGNIHGYSYCIIGYNEEWCRSSCQCEENLHIKGQIGRKEEHFSQSKLATNGLDTRKIIMRKYGAVETMLKSLKMHLEVTKAKMFHTKMNEMKIDGLLLVTECQCYTVITLHH